MNLVVFLLFRVTLEGLDTKLLIHKVDIGMIVEDAAKMGPEWTSDSPMVSNNKRF